MKKIIAILLICLMLFSLAACGKTTPNSPAAEDAANKAPEEASNGPITIDETPAEETQPDAAEDVQNVGDADQNTDENTDAQYTTYETIDEINQRTGARIARPTNVEIPYEQFETVMLDDVEIAQYAFEAGGVQCGVRFCPDFNLCISEIPTEDGSMLFDGSHTEETVTINGCMAAHWETVDGQYVLVVASEDAEFFNSLYEEIKAGTIPADS